MSDVTTEVQSASLEEIPETACHPDFDLILTHWPRIAAVAWQGAVSAGPGAVQVTVRKAGTEIVYRPGSPCSCHPIAADTYTPDAEAVVLVRRGNRCSVPLILNGWPTPPEAFAVTSAALMRESVQ